MAISSSSTGLRPGVCTSTTRPTNPYTGMLIYETDTGYLRVWDGSAWDYLSQKQDYTAGLTTGKILQVVSATTTTGVSSTSTTYVDSTLSATITPNSTSSKIIVVTNQHGYSGAASNDLNYRLVRDSTALQTWAAMVVSSAGAVAAVCGFTYLDSPNTTSPVTYKTQIARGSGTNLVYMQVNGSQGSMLLYEVAG